jgi:hypothetical protein
LVATEDDDEEADNEDSLEPEKVECFPIFVVGMNASHGEYSCSEPNTIDTARFHRDDKIVMVVSLLLDGNNVEV